MNLNFLFMDDSYSPITKVSSLTGVIVPVSSYPALRVEFYKLLQWAIRPEEGVIASAPELHGLNFLPERSDADKFTFLREIVSLIIRQELRIYRIGYFVTNQLEQLMIKDKRLNGVCWLSLLSMMEPLLKEEMLIHVMDGFNKNTVQSLSGMIKSCDEWRSAGLERDISLRHSGNLLGEVFYADSKYSALIQITDVVAYLRAASDLVDLNKPLTSFKKQIADISSNLKPAIVWEEVISLILNGKVQGPPEKVKAIYRTYGPVTRLMSIIPSDTEDITWPNNPAA